VILFFLSRKKDAQLQLLLARQDCSSSQQLMLRLSSRLATMVPNVQMMQPLISCPLRLPQMVDSLGAALLVQFEQIVQTVSHQECLTAVQQQEGRRLLVETVCPWETVVSKWFSYQV
jgi:hypothetical protein